MDITILGAGNVGAALAKGWARIGHAVTVGVRDLQGSKVRELVDATPGVRIAPIGQATSAARVVVLAVPWSAAEAVLAAAGDLGGKIVVDCTNPLRRDLTGLSVGAETSAGEMVAAWARGAHVVKCFNTTGSANLEHATTDRGAPVMFLCGDDARSKAEVAALAAGLGFEPVDAGGIGASRHLEHLALLWVDLAYQVGLGPDIAFLLGRRAT